VKVSVLGLGYVGAVTAACLADLGHDVVGVDIDSTKVDQINRAEPPVIEPGLPEMITNAVDGGGLSATVDVSSSVLTADLILVCVGTPSTRGGGQSTDALRRATSQIGEAIAGRKDRPTVVYRSTILPGTCEDLLIPLLEETSGLRCGDDFGVAMNPEFLREGKAIEEFRDPEKTVIGQFDESSGEAVAAMYEGINGQIFQVGLKEAELIKYAENAFHALKISFANEIGALGRELGVDSHRTMNMLCTDRRLNISPAYLRPGFAFGGSCLPKDVRAITQKAGSMELETPVLGSLMRSNSKHIDWVVDQVAEVDARKVGVFGLAFKDGTDDLRESPMLEVCERLIGKGYDLKVFDRTIRLSALRGANKRFVEAHLPHIEGILTESPEEVVQHAEVCVIGSADPDGLKSLESSRATAFIDLVRVPDHIGLAARDGYVGIAW
jgi:GDP-mannose 6-dehydrogenase